MCARLGLELVIIQMVIMTMMAVRGQTLKEVASRLIIQIIQIRLMTLHLFTLSSPLALPT